MGKIAFIFPGQGSQKPGMGKDVAEKYKSAMEIFDKANDILGFDLKSICFNGTEEQLKDTSITQPALFTTSAAILSALKEESNITPDFVAGHSLGEYTAYYSSGAISFEDGLKAVRKRGLLMAQADKEGKGTMYAVLKLDDHIVENICQELSSEGVIVPANYNCPGQVVISGERKALEASKKPIEEAKGRVMPLPVGGAFHSPLMKPASEELKIHIDKSFSIKQTPVKVISNVYATYLTEDKIKTSLVEQLLSPVRWSKSMEKLVEEGVEKFIEIGPGTVLQGLMKKINSNKQTIGIQDIETLKNFIQNFK
jgi:[acyl-carrier-protein] S-malonyltransferase